MKVESIPEMALTEADDAGIAELLRLAFNIDFGGRSFYKQRHHLRLIVRDGTAVIGHMALCFRAILIGSRLTDIVGLAEVATHPDHRKQGIASTLMKEALAAARATKAEFFILFGDEPLYAATGFVTQPNTMTFTATGDVGTDKVMTDSDDGLMVMPLCDNEWNSTAHVDILGRKF